MFSQLHPALAALIESCLFVLVSAGVIHFLRLLGGAGERVREWLARAPALDAAVAWLTLGPPAAAWAFAAMNGRDGWTILLCIAAAVAGQIVALYIWCFLHELCNPAAKRGPRLVDAIGKNLAKSGSPGLVGRLRNHLALLWMLWAVPLFSVVRFAEYWVYPVLVWLTRLPRYRSGDWVNISRHKVSGLVGHDLIWCLYCDWMTGVWSLGTEMLRNIESFWCPIRFASPEKCSNCTMDFPDIDGGWIGADQAAADAANLIESRYPAPDGSNAWLGHTVRLTVKGK
jgi:hypothetical protein